MHCFFTRSVRMVNVQEDMMKINTTSTLEFGFRIQSTQASYRELEALLGKDAKVDWAKTPAHKHGGKYFAIPGEIKDDGRVDVPNQVVDAFTRYGGFLMVKLVTPLPKGKYSNLAKFNQLWDFDKMQPQRANGDWVYSMPIHGLEKAGEGRKFFFTISIEGNEQTATLTIEKVDVTRGKSHFTIETKKVGQFTSAPSMLAQVTDRYAPKDADPTYKPLKDLPIALAVQKFMQGLIA